MKLRRLAVVTALVLSIAGCEGGASPSDRSSSAAGSTRSAADVDFTAPDPAALAPGVAVGDQTGQALFDVAARGDSVVAVGQESAANVLRPLILVSGDAGHTWRRADVTAADDVELTVREWPGEVVATDEGFLAVGDDASGTPVRWTSTDGSDWVRDDLGPQFRQDDWVNGLKVVDGTIVAVGGNSKPVGDASDGALVWLSEDGESWERIDATRQLLGVGNRAPGGETALRDVVAAGGEWAMAGTITDARLSSIQPDRVRVWRSRDRGRTWISDPLPIDFAGDYRASAVTLVAEGRRVHLMANGDGLSEQRYGSSSWDVVVMTDAGSGWMKQSPDGLSSRAHDYGTFLLRTSGGWVAGIGQSDAPHDARLLTGSTLDGLRDVSRPSLSGPRQQAVNAAVEARGDVVVVGASGATGSIEPRIWRLAGNRVRDVELPEEATGGQPSLDVDVLVAAGEDFVALGEGSGSPIAWQGRDFASWRATGLPGRARSVTSVAVTDAVSLADGSIVAVGSGSSGDGTDALVWKRDPAGSWRPRPRVKAHRSDEGFGRLRPSALAGRDDRLVMVADAGVNGQTEGLPLISLDGGDSWSLGRGSNRAPRRYGDDPRRTPWEDFRSPLNGSVNMAGIVAARDAWVAVGSRRTARASDRPAAWWSKEGRTWRRLGMPLPEGAYASSASHVVEYAEELVAVGSYVTEPGADAGWATWVSRDAGRTWRVGQIVAKEKAFVSEVLVADGVLVALGAVGSGRDLDAAAWISRDGRSWESIDLGIDRTGGPGNQLFRAGLVDGDRLRIVGMDVPPQGGGFYSASVPFPR